MSFDPEKAPRVDFNDVYGEYESPDGPYRRTADYDQLLALYREAVESLEAMARRYSMQRIVDIQRRFRDSDSKRKK